MPNLVVYVPARVARTLEARGVSKDVQRRACAEVLDGLANGVLEEGVVAGVPVSETVPPHPVATSSSSPPLSEGEVTRTKSGRSSSPGSSKCPADTPRGTRCKLCGKEH